MDIDFHNPRHTALMALHLAHFPVESIADDFLNDPDSEGFDLVFDVGDGRRLTLGWDELARTWWVDGRLTPDCPIEQVAMLVLSINQVLPAGLRWQTAVDAPWLDVHAELVQSEGLEPDALALQITDVAMWLHRVGDAVAAESFGLAEQASATASALPNAPHIEPWAVRG